MASIFIISSACFVLGIFTGVIMMCLCSSKRLDPFYEDESYDLYGEEYKRKHKRKKNVEDEDNENNNAISES